MPLPRSTCRQASAGCSSLASISLGAGTTTIAIDTFRNCPALESIIVPESNENFTIHDGILFSKDLTAIDVDPANALYTSVDGVVFDKNLTELLAYPGGKRDLSYEIPEGTVKVQRFAFSNAVFLETVTMADSVIELGEGAFSNCLRLQSVGFNDEITAFPRLLFSGSVALRNFEIPGTITSVGNQAFEGCHGLTSITLPDTVTSLGQRAFFNCASLEEAFIGTGLSSLPVRCFENCENLELIRFFGFPDFFAAQSNAVSGVSDSARIVVPAFELKGWRSLGEVRIHHLPAVRVDEGEVHVEIDSPFARVMTLFHSRDLQNWTQVENVRRRGPTFIIPADAVEPSSPGAYFQGRLALPN